MEGAGIMIEIKTQLELWKECRDSIQTHDIYDGIPEMEKFNDMKWVRVDDILKILEEHRHCSHYHKVMDEMNPSQYYLKACLLQVLDELSQLSDVVKK
jgi:DNA polymerase III alpha subunit (gram-positive type)